MPTFTLTRGSEPLLISLPHDGTGIPESMLARMTPAARRVPDTDWHVGRLYAFARELGASLIVPRYSRYVVDLNRPSDGAALYPGKHETGLVPLETFGGAPIYLAGRAPDVAELRERVANYWRPYHDAVRAELAHLVAVHGRALLWDGHSIRSEVPLFFDGRLPDLNLGTADGHSCSAALQQRLEGVLRAQQRYSHVVNGRFKGGYITRHYGTAGSVVEAVQLELGQRIYMNEETFEYDSVAAAPLQALIRRLLETALAEVVARGRQGAA
jgi:N-formylglutamate deformylase